MITNLLRPSWFSEIWALCMSWITYDHLSYTPCLVHWSPFGSLVPAMCTRLSCAQVHKSPQSHCVVTERAYCFHDYIYITPILLLWDLRTLCVVDHLLPLILHSLLSSLITLWFIGTSNVYSFIMCPSA